MGFHHRRQGVGGGRDQLPGMETRPTKKSTVSGRSGFPSRQKKERETMHSGLGREDVGAKNFSPLSPTGFHGKSDMNHEKISRRIQWMESDLSSVRHWIKSGQFLNSVSNQLRHATLWAMEACLMAFGHEEEAIGQSVLTAFIELIPSDIRHPLVNCHVDAVMLDSYEGDWENWKKLATDCLEETETAVLRIKLAIENQLKANQKD